MSILEFPAATKPPAFDYARFRAEFARRKRQTVYERINETRARDVLPVLDNGRPRWVTAAASGALKALVSHPGVFSEHRSSSGERQAIDNLEDQACTWIQAEHNRTVLNRDEYAALEHERHFLTRFEHPDHARRFRVTHLDKMIRYHVSLQAKSNENQPTFAPEAFDALHVPYYVAYRMKLTRAAVLDLLETGGRVVELRAALGCDDLFAVEAVAVPAVRKTA